MRLNDIQPNKVYLDADSCSKGHNPCLRYFSSGNCHDCDKESKKRRAVDGHLVGEDIYCRMCGDPVAIGSRRLLCQECWATRKQWERGKFYVCVQGPKEFIGGRFRQEEMDWTLKYEAWDVGMVFEEWQDQKYRETWIVLQEDGKQELLRVRNG